MFAGVIGYALYSKSWRLVRAAGTAPDPADVLGNLRPAGGAMARMRQTTLLVMRRGPQPEQFVTVRSHRISDSVARGLATAFGARAEEVPELPDLSHTPVVGWLVARPSEVASRDTQAGADPTLVAQLLGRSMPPGAWLAASVRPPRKAEQRNIRRWYRSRLDGASTHHANDGDAVVVTLVAGGESAEEVRDLLTQVVSTLPGFDVDVKVRIGRTLPTVATESALAVAAWAGVGVEFHHWLWASAAGVAPALLAAGTAFGVVPTRASLVTKRLHLGRLPRPARRWISARRPTAAGTRPDGTTVRAREGGYPLAPSCFLLGPAVFVGLVSPHAGTGAGAATTTMRQAPPALLADIGPMVGFAGDGGQRVHICDDDREAGVSIFGQPGVGKSVLVQNLFAADSLERVRPSGRPGRAGAANTLVVFENKGAEGVTEYLERARETGDALLVVEMADPDTPAIDLFAVPGTSAQRASFFVNAMVYAFGDTAIQDRSFETLTQVLSMALCTPDHVALDAGIADPHPVAVAHALLGGIGDDVAVALAAKVASFITEATDAGQSQGEATEALRRLGPLFGAGVTAAQRRTLSESPRNKLALLMEADQWWSTARPKATWQQALEQHWAVVLNTGSTTSGALVNERLTECMSAMLMFSLRDAIKRYCNGWQHIGRSVSVFADELSLLAGTSPEVVSWMRSQGRSYGVRPVFATQFPDQLLPKVRSALMSFGTVFWFTQNNATVLNEAVADLTGDGGQWSAADIANLEKYHAVLRATVDKRRQPAVPVRIAYWGDGRSSFAEDQGYGSTAAATSRPGDGPAQMQPTVPADDRVDPYGGTGTSVADPYDGGAGW